MQAKVDLMLQDIAKTNAEKMTEYREKLAAQQQLEELAAKYEEVLHRLDARDKVPKPRHAGSH